MSDSMKLSRAVDLFKDKDSTTTITQDPVSEDIVIDRITFDSRAVKPNTLFVCKGLNFKASYLKDAIDRGAVAYLSEQDYAADIPGIIVEDIRLAMAQLANFFYQSPWQDVAISGITGTKGKTTTAGFVNQILSLDSQEKGQALPGFVSSTFNYDGLEKKPSTLTTPEAMDLYEMLATMRDNHVKCATMEVSSQALKYHRVDDVQMQVVAFLNISPDHISPVEHPTFADYFQSKLRIFEHGKVAVINEDTDHYEEILKAAKDAENIERIVTVSRKNPNADYFADDLTFNETSQTFVVKNQAEEIEMNLNVLGHFNINNALVAAAIARENGVAWSTIQRALGQAKTDGRMEVYRSEDRYLTFVVDFAHNKISFEELFNSVKEMAPDNDIRIVFGSAGGKAENRRPDMGHVAGLNTNEIYLTSDDPNFEDAYKIMGEIEEGVLAVNPEANVRRNLDRTGSIYLAYKDALAAGKPTTIVVAGKGSEDTIKVNGRNEFYVADFEYVQQLIAFYELKGKI
ncbi:UDP-N-acetylmuramyl-tripeptide synthetase [Aerococcaceae bacterium 50-4]